MRAEFQPHGVATLILRPAIIASVVFQRLQADLAESCVAEPDVARLIRLSTKRGPRHFDIQWHRHTAKPFFIYSGPTLSQAIDTLKADGILQPL